MTQLASSGGYKDQVLYVLSEEPSSSLSFEKPSSVLPQVVAERFETLRVSQESTPQSHIDKQRESEATKKVDNL